MIEFKELLYKFVDAIPAMMALIFIAATYLAWKEKKRFDAVDKLNRILYDRENK